ncbi:2-dehydro-3-deoxygluconate kinase [Bacillus sp. JCM 19046]|nr:2-dehydro-3-deoxygluconate kinase [Bacillus sp. JCM 19046]
MDVLSMGETMVLFSPRLTGQMRYETEFHAKIAGAETNALIGLQKLGHQTSWISRVGADELGHKIIHAVRGEGVDTTHVTYDKEHATGLFFKEKTMEDVTTVSYYRQNSAASTLDETAIETVDVESFTYVYLTGITPVLSRSCEKAVQQLVGKAKLADVPLVFDPNIRRTLIRGEAGKQLIKELIGAASLVLPGKEEGAFLFGTTDEKEIANHCLELGAKTVIVKLGADGAYYKDEKTSGYVNAFPVSRIIDPVGAGDGFAAGLLSGLLDKRSLQEAVQRGCAVGAMVTQVNGDIEGLPTRAQLEAFMQSERTDVLR